jgi:hypothetical protein
MDIIMTGMFISSAIIVARPHASINWMFHPFDCPADIG